MKWVRDLVSILQSVLILCHVASQGNTTLVHSTYSRTHIESTQAVDKLLSADALRVVDCGDEG